MGRTALNVAGQALVPAIVARREGILDEELYNAPRSEGGFVAQEFYDERIAGEAQRLHEVEETATPLIWQANLAKAHAHGARRYCLAPCSFSLSPPCPSMGEVYLSNVIKTSRLILFSLRFEKSYDLNGVFHLLRG